MDKILKIEKLKLKRDKIKTFLNREDPLFKSFYGGRVGFLRPKAQRKREQQINKEFDLMRELKEIEDSISRLENPMIRTKHKEQNPNEWEIGQVGYEPFGNPVKIIKINIKTVTIEYSGGFKEVIKPHLLSK